MGQVYDDIDDRLRDFLLAQRVFFVGTAPAGPHGHVNISPKGMSGTFAVLDRRRVAYLDYTGSGAETLAHLRENGRIALMFCAFEGPPKIVRLHGRGSFIPAGDAGCAALLSAFADPPDVHSLRAVVQVEVSRVSDSCGYAVPLMAHHSDRDLLLRSHARRTDEQMVEYRASRNHASVDGLPIFGPTD